MTVDISDGADNATFAKRSDTMYLSTVERKSRPEHKNKSSISFHDVADIEGARPSLGPYKYTNKQDMKLNIRDIAGSSPKKLHPDRASGATWYLSNEDIEGSRPCPFQFRTTRCVDPLQPAYPLPSAAPTEPPAPQKFIRDQIDIKDIAGSSPQKYYRFPQRETMGVRDIQGAYSSWGKKYNKSSVKEIMRVDDINGAEGFRSSRQTNPLSPRYLVDARPTLVDTSQLVFSASGTVTELGEIEGNHPHVTKGKQDPKNTTFSLLTSDIPGAQPDTVGVSPLGKTRQHWREVTNIRDIPGAQADTVKRVLKTKRQTNPLDPSYVLPGANETVSPPGMASWARPDHQAPPRASKSANARVPTLNTSVSASASNKPPTPTPTAAVPIASRASTPSSSRSLTSVQKLDRFVQR
eukprot:GILK01002401.1.p1 GENE.GILK01002401.1~~GILK01002401.1.p1  ORF type:complete len:432 (+),score=32.46 GILK01002401.1:70-1296(+)